MNHGFVAVICLAQSIGIKAVFTHFWHRLRIVLEAMIQQQMQNAAIFSRDTADGHGTDADKLF